MCLFTWLSAYCWPPHWDVDVSGVGFLPVCLFTWLSAYCWPPHWDVDVSGVGFFTYVLVLPVC